MRQIWDQTDTGLDSDITLKLAKKKKNYFPYKKSVAESKGPGQGVGVGVGEELRCQ